MKLKLKLSIGLIFLFIVILVFGIVGIFTVNRLTDDFSSVLRNNEESLIFCNQMLRALETIGTNQAALAKFQQNLGQQQHNITEPGEYEVTAQLQADFKNLEANLSDSSRYAPVRKDLIDIQELNQLAILRKNTLVQQTSNSLKLWLTITFTILTLISFVFIFNLPGIVSRPIQSLADGINAIANKDYSKRIHLKQKDEFGELANAFNKMAERLDAYENSNIARMQFEKSRLEAIINQMSDAIVGLDNTNRILFLNARAQSLLGLKESDIAGHYAPDIALTNDLMRTLLQVGNDKTELKIYADNQESYFTREMITLTSSDVFTGKVILLRNITPFHELSQAKTNFIATVSHELKTPIYAIRMGAQLLNDKRVGDLNPEQTSLAKSIGDDSERLLKIVAELLNLNQVETGNIPLTLHLTNPGVIAERALKAVIFPAQQKNIKIKPQIEPNLATIQVDEEKCSWVLINFLTNAIKYSFEGDIIELSLYGRNGRISFTVQDHGRGIDAKYLSRIFDRYFKVPGTSEDHSTGLGLAISKEFIEAQGGKIEVSSVAGQGSVFGFSFPEKNS